MIRTNHLLPTNNLKVQNTPNSWQDIVRMEYEEINIRELSEKFLSMQSHKKMHLEIKK